ncbi:MAG: RHS domain-containing protein [Nanoarchaeota archaeon]|nr:RHS domain-containing protein [Nanoarchaeota archaeon]
MKKLVIIFLFCILLTSSVSAYKIYYYHNDHLGNPVAITNEDGEVVWKADYEPFGEVFNEENIQTTNKYNYNTKELDENTNLLYYGNRFYDSSIGRFTTADTVKGSLGNPQSLNRYSYVLNNPLKYVDLRGNQEYQGPPVPGQNWEEYQGQMSSPTATIFITDIGDFSRKDRYIPFLNFFGIGQITSGNKQSVNAIVQGVENLREAYEKEGYKITTILGYQSSPEAGSMLEKRLGIQTLGIKETVTKVESLIKNERGLSAFVGHSVRNEDLLSIPLTRLGNEWFTRDYLLFNQKENLFNVGLFTNVPSTTTQKRCEFYGCGIINSPTGTIGGLQHEGIIFATGARKYMSYNQIVGQFNYMVNGGYWWFKDKAFRVNTKN